MTPEQPQASRDDSLARAFDLLTAVLSDAAPPELPPDLAQHPEVAQLYALLYDLRVFIFNLAQGDLAGNLDQRGYLAGALKSLQANLRHLTWQTQMIAAGDLSQQIDFMGDFSQAFNRMVASLIEARQGERRRATEAETLYQAGTIVAASLQQEEAVKRILAQLQRVVPYDRAFVLLLRTEQDAAQSPEPLPILEVLGSNGLPELGSPQKALYRPNPGGPAARVILSRQPLALDDLQTEALAFDFFSAGVHGWLGVPLILGHRLMGMLILQSLQIGAFSADHVRLATAFADQVAIALENARLFESTQILAASDPLTGVLNRRHFFELAITEFQSALIKRAPLAVIMIDLDHFKRINDRRGHQAGDMALKEATRRCQAGLRQKDLIARYGGEEFVVLLPEISPSGALAVAARLRARIAGEPFSIGEEPFRITISLGVATLAFDDSGASFTDFEALLADADKALYAAKAAGRNQVWYKEANQPALWNEPQ